MQLIDAHCHLQDSRIFAFLPELTARASERGIFRMVCCGCCEDDWPRVETAAIACQEIVPAFGLHPWYAAQRSVLWRSRLIGYLARFPQAGIGEIGLDYMLSAESFAAQEEVFTAQLALALSFGRPVSIHCRRAWKRMMELLRERAGALPRAMIHSYSGGAGLVAELQEMGFYLSFSGSITYARNRHAHVSINQVAAGRLLIETDSPDIIPAGVAARANEPGNLPLVAAAAARLRNAAIEEIGACTSRNAQRLFGGDA
jgi:TatD DNase family protein